MSVTITDHEIRAQAAIDGHRARRHLFSHLANAAHQIRYEIEDGESFVYDFCHMVRPQLHRIGINTGKAWNDQVLLALARAGGPLQFTKGTGPDPARLTKSLLTAVCEECWRRGDLWFEGEMELERRKALKGIHSIVWTLRDCGILAMTAQIKTDDPQPRFP